MGATNSKAENIEALRLCKERKRFIKQALDSRYALAAAHACYIQSLRNIGFSLRRYAEAEVLIESSLSASATGLDKTPSRCSYPSPVDSHLAEVSDSPLHSESPLSPAMATLSYMRSGAAAAVTVRLEPGRTNFVDVEPIPFTMPPPPPPCPESGSSWDYFDTTDDFSSLQFSTASGFDANFDDEGGWGQFKGEGASATMVGAGEEWTSGGFDNTGKLRKRSARSRSEEKANEFSGSSATQYDDNHGCSSERHAHSFSSGAIGRTPQRIHAEARILDMEQNGNPLARKVTNERSNSKKDGTSSEVDMCAEQEDPSEFITHRAKDFVSSIKDIEHRFFRASEAGKEVSRLLEANKIRVGYLDSNGTLSASAFLDSLRLVCCRGKSALCHETPQSKVITWKRSASSRSSSSRRPLTQASKDDIDDSGSDFIEEFSMIAGSHSSTLERLYAWERKLYDEVKASEAIRKEYDRKCEHLRHLFAKDYSTHVIDKTRAVVKDLHSRIRVAIFSVDSISKRIEKMRDEELQPQLMELIQGLISMWKAMLECHHAQYITISLAYHSRSVAGTPQGDVRKQIMDRLLLEVECFGLSFANWINSLASYMEALNGWLQNCIVQPRERSRSRRPFSPRRVVAPPIFVLCRDWLAGIKDLPASELGNAIKMFLSDLHQLMSREAEAQKHQKMVDANDGELGSKDDEKHDMVSTNLSCMQTSLTKVLDWLTKFSEASLKMYEEIRQRSEAARIAYSNYKPAWS